MSSFTIIGSEKGKSIAPLSLFDLTKEIELALNELNINDEIDIKKSNKTTQLDKKAETNNINLSNIYSLENIITDENEFCKYIFTESFKNGNYYIMNKMNISERELFKTLAYNNGIFASIVDRNEREIITDVMNSKNIQQYFIVDIVEDISNSLNNDKFKVIKQLSQFAIRTFFYNFDAFDKIFKDITNELQDYYNINFIEIFTISFMKTKQNMAKDTISAIQKHMQDNNCNLKQALENILGLYDEEKLKPIVALIKKDSSTQQRLNTKLHNANNTKNMQIDIEKFKKYSFELDNDMKDIESKLNESFELGCNMQQYIHRLFKQFESIIVKNNDYNTYTREQRQLAKDLINIYKETNNILLDFNIMINTNLSELSPMQTKRFYIKNISNFIDSMKSIDYSTIKPRKELEFLDNPFMKDL